MSGVGFAVAVRTVGAPTIRHERMQPYQSMAQYN